MKYMNIIKADIKGKTYTNKTVIKPKYKHNATKELKISRHIPLQNERTLEGKYTGSKIT